MESMRIIIKALGERLVADIRQPNDYVRDDGILICGVCGKPKVQEVIKDGVRVLLVPTNCECQQRIVDEIRRQDAIAAQKKLDEERELYRKNRLMDASHAKYTFESDDRKHDRISDRLLSYCGKAEEMLKANLGIALTGDTGSGKTFYAACIANRLIDMGFHVWMTNIASIIRDTMNGDDENKARITRRILSVDWLILDDFGTERRTEFSDEQVYQIINTRYNAQKPLIITTNLSKKELIDSAVDTKTSRIMSRINEMCPAVFQVTGDRRNNIAQERLKLMSELMKGTENE